MKNYLEEIYLILDDEQIAKLKDEEKEMNPLEIAQRYRMVDQKSSQFKHRLAKEIRQYAIIKVEEQRRIMTKWCNDGDMPIEYSPKPKFD